MATTTSNDQLTDLSVLAEGLAEGRTLVVGGEDVVLSEGNRRTLSEVCEILAQGKPVEVYAVEEYVSTQEAANMLSVSRPTVVRMLEQGLLEWDRPGVHRRVLRASVAEFMRNRRARRQAGLDELARDAPPGPDRIVRTR